MKLKKITDHVFYLKNPVNIGVIKTGEGVILVDTGLDESTGKKLLAALQKKELYPIAVINTHAHADHCGANAYIKENTGARIYAVGTEKEFIEKPSLEPFCFFAGAEPINDLKTKFLQAHPVKVDEVIETENSINIGESDLEVILLPGHSLNQIGIAYEGVLFCGDSLFSRSILNKHRIPFYMNIGKQKETLNYLFQADYEYYLPAHGELTVKENIKELISANREIIEEIEKYILKIISTAKTTEDIIKKVSNNFNYKVRGAYQYYLLNTSVMAYLSYLYNNNMIKYQIAANILYWKKI